MFWLCEMFAESQIKASERDPEYCLKKMVVKRCSWGTCDARSRSPKRLQFILCVCSHRQVCPRIMGNNSPVFLFFGVCFFPNRSIGRASDSRFSMTVTREFEPRQEYKKICVGFMSQPCCADSLSVCPTPSCVYVGMRMITHARY